MIGEWNELTNKMFNKIGEKNELINKRLRQITKRVSSLISNQNKVMINLANKLLR